MFYSHSPIFFFPHFSSVCYHVFDIIEMILIPNLLFFNYPTCTSEFFFIDGYGSNFFRRVQYKNWADDSFTS